MEIIELPEFTEIASDQASLFDPQLVSEFGNLLVQEAAQLGCSFGFEPSVRFSPGRLATNRFLLTLTCDSLGESPARWLTGFMSRTAMPVHWRPQIEAALSGTSFVHFGFEEGADDLLYKFYLEHTVQTRHEAIVPNQLVPLYTGYKWSVVRPDRQFITDYRWYPSISWPEVWNHLQSMAMPAIGHSTADLSPSWSFLQTLWPRLLESQDWTPRLTEVTETGTPRRSYDLNVYDAMLQLQDLHDAMMALGEDFGIGKECVVNWLESNRSRLLGHVAVGRQRSGVDFVTLYYGAQSYDA